MDFYLLCEEKDRVEGTGTWDCTDGADNDGDGLFDCDDDGCTGSPDCSDEDTGDASDQTTVMIRTQQTHLIHDDDTDDDDTDDTDDTTVESPNRTGVWRVDMNLNFSCDHSFGGTTADEDNDQQTIMLQLSGPPNDLYAVTPERILAGACLDLGMKTDSSWVDLSVWKSMVIRLIGTRMSLSPRQKSSPPMKSTVRSLEVSVPTAVVGV